MRLLIVDDERPARARLIRMLGTLAVQFGIRQIEEAADAVQALEMIEAGSPDVLFLDIHMPEISGLELAASLPASREQAPPLIVFVTAFDQYALQAFDANAIDYLLKPFDQMRLLRALQRVNERWQAREQMALAGVGAREVRVPAAGASEKETATVGIGAGSVLAPAGDGDGAGKDPASADGGAGLNGAAPAPVPAAACGQPLRQLLISERGQTRIVRLEQLAWIETADNYVILHGVPGSPLLRQTLSGLLANLQPEFVRCHRRAAVRISLIERVLALDKGDAELLLAGGARVPCSRQYRAGVMAALAPV